MSVLIKVPGLAHRDLLRVVDGACHESQEPLVVLWEDMGWDQVNCQLYSSWHLGKHKLVVIPDREGLVPAVGQSLKVDGV